MSDAPVRDVQTLVQRLMRFWIDEGCSFLPGYDAPVMAALQHPKAFRAVVGPPEPSRLAFVQTVRRPRDSRYGAQPYRLGQHLQLEVMLSPAPDDLLASYLRSLRALGMQLDLHDLRFAEGRWAMPALGARGRGWNVRIDGMGVTRVTLLQRAGDAALTPVRAEIVYGVERLATCLAGAASVFDVAWAASGPSYGALFREDEAERSRYDLTLIDVDALAVRWQQALVEADSSLAVGLWGPAYEAAMRAVFILEQQAARGVLGLDDEQAGQAAVAQRVAAVSDAWAGRGTPSKGQAHDES